MYAAIYTCRVRARQFQIAVLPFNRYAFCLPTHTACNYCEVSLLAE